jgi:hypothetical protein
VHSPSLLSANPRVSKRVDAPRSYRRNPDHAVEERCRITPEGVVPRGGKGSLIPNPWRVRDVKASDERSQEWISPRGPLRLGFRREDRDTIPEASDLGSRIRSGNAQFRLRSEVIPGRRATYYHAIKEATAWFHRPMTRRMVCWARSFLLEPRR